MNSNPDMREQTMLLQRFMAFLRNRLIAGLFIIIPIVITLWVAGWSIAFLTDWAVDYCQATQWFAYPGMVLLIRIVTIIVLVVLTILIGQLAKITLGSKLIEWTQKILLKLPLLRIVYSTCEQIGETVKTSQGGLFKEVALFEYPKKGSYAIGFVTNFNEEHFEVTDAIRSEVYSIFMPTTPNPTSGFLIFVPKEECRILKMSVSEAMTLIVSGGVILPGKKLNLQEEGVKIK